MNRPEGIAYAVASGVGAICGLYATIARLLAYAPFGPSQRHGQPGAMMAKITK